MQIREDKQNSDYYKICPVCKQLFNKRKKWKTVWPYVIYCSNKCKNEKKNKKLELLTLGI